MRSESILEDPDEDDEQTLLDPRDRYKGDNEEMLAKKKEGISCWGHVFMIVLFLTIMTVYLKNSYLQSNESYSYMLALAVPVALLTIILGIIIYQRYLEKLQDSHRSVYYNVLSLLVVCCVCVIASVILLCFYLNSPKENKDFLIYSAIPYYIVVVLLAAFFIYVSPGLLDKMNGIPTSRFFIICVYLLFLFILPVAYILS